MLPRNRFQDEDAYVRVSKFSQGESLRQRAKENRTGKGEHLVSVRSQAKSHRKTFQPDSSVLASQASGALEATNPQ